MSIVIGPVRVSYVHLFTPYQGEGMGEPKYTLTALVPKSDTATMQMIEAARFQCQQEAIAPQGAWKGFPPPHVKCTIYDGDGVQPNSGKPMGEECEGHWVIRMSSKRKPGVVNEFAAPITDESKVYSGCWGYVSFNFFAYDNQGSKGISAGLNNFMFVRDDESFGGATSANQDFAGLFKQPPIGGAPITAPQQAPPTAGYQKGFTNAPQGMPTQAPHQAPPQQGYAPPQQGYAPPQQGYAPPQQGYAPPQQGYAPQGMPTQAPPAGQAVQQNFSLM